MTSVLRALCLLALCVLAPLAFAQGQNGQVLDNGKLRFGDGAQNSVNTEGNLEQPFYYDPGMTSWFALTFSNYPLDNAIGIGGNGTAEWNINGSIEENPALTNQVIDSSGFVPLSGNVGYGTLISTGTVDINGSTLTMRNTYELGQDKAYVKITTRITNTSAATVSNVRVWVGTRDDFVGMTDTPTKTRGNLDSNGFVALTNAATRAAAIRITSGQQGVLFYSSSTKAHTSVNSCCQFSQAYQQNPATSANQLTNDGSYALFVRMSDLAVGASEEFTWYYAAGAIADLTTIIGDLAGEVVNNVNVTSSAGTGGTITPANVSVVPGATAQFTVTPSANYHIDTVQGCSGSLNGSTYTTGAISTTCNVSATFALNTYQVTASAATGGTISPANATVTHGQTTAFTVTPSAGYVLDGVTGCGGALAGNVYTTGAVTAACAVTANFRVLHTVTSSADSGGTVSPASVEVANGDAVTFTLTPAVGYSVGSAQGCGNGTLDGNVYTATNITAACAVVGIFVPTPPSFTVTRPAVFEMNSTELLTELPATAKPSAVDYLGAAATVTLQGDQTRFAPGSHTLTWQAVDSRGTVGNIEQTLRVWPTVSFGPDLSIGARAGNFDSFRIALNGRAPVYPFSVRYTVSGDSQGTTLESGTAVFENGEVEKSIPFAVQTTAAAGAAERTVQVALDEQLNRGSTRALTVTLTTINQAPRVNLQIGQGGEERRVASRDAGPITFTADVTDPDTTDTHTVEWRAPSGATFTVSGDSIVVQPGSLTAGVHRFEVIVTDNGTPPQITRRTFDVVVLETTPVLPAGATRLLANGLPDSPEYAPVAPNVLPERGGQLTHHLMEADAGTRLSLGAYAMYRGAYQTELPGTASSFQIPDDSVSNHGGYFDFVVDDLPRAGESVSVVIPQRAPIPAQPVYRKYDPATRQWRTFFEDNDNHVASAPGSEGFCPPTASTEYRNGLHAGDWCVRLTIKDGSVNDADGAVNGSVSDPGGVGVLSNVQVTGRSGGGGVFDLWLLAGVAFLLMLKTMQRRQAMAMLAMLGLVASQARAADDDTSWYVGGQFGSARSYVSANAIDRALNSQGYPVSSEVSKKSREAWRVYGGYEFTRWLALEAGYSDLGDVKVEFSGPVADVGPFLAAANALQPPSAEGWDITAVARLPIGSRASAYARAGVFIWDARYDTRSADGQRVRRDDSDSSSIAGIGAQVRVFDRWSMGAEFTRYGIAGDHIDFGGVSMSFRW
ncbi:outer membrane beta-barrel protein [Steroidobacter sp.]|uniref:outer membrane beta-barrel protein n=1 Tax=Steroidobacter sp. TaxID=1978227 RepID=UPI001A53373F|nr:outer membrane beta-barrel protein [Steroidobacter sp.]MBL8269443.1 outer membrane beta-barrel protein [Steroidobacter sp.]